MHGEHRGGRRRTREEIERVLEQYYRSGQTQSDFTREHGVGLSTLQRWLNGSAGKPNRKAALPAMPTWVEVAPAAAISVQPSAPRSYRLDLPGGISLRVEGGFDAAEIQQLLRVLR